MAQYNIGQASIVNKGEYSATTPYVLLNSITHRGGTYLCILACTGVEPGVSEGWQTNWILSQDGIYDVQATSLVEGQTTLRITFTSGQTREITYSTSTIPDGSITTAKLADSAVTTDKISNASVTTSKLATGAVTSDIIADGAVTTSDLANNAVTNAKLGNASVSTEKLGANSVTTAKIADGNVTEAKLADNSVTADKIADGAVGFEKLGLWGKNSPIVNVPNSREVTLDDIGKTLLLDNDNSGCYIYFTDEFISTLPDGAQFSFLKRGAANSGVYFPGTQWVLLGMDGGVSYKASTFVSINTRFSQIVMMVSKGGFIVQGQVTVT